ncbi:MAG: hypothetical protein MZV70_62420, partial [Desulfobacterales bacterium]|nr:hypothetical protein [Desulfobacterales bacterium]
GACSTMKIRFVALRGRADGARQLPEPRRRQRHLPRRRRRPERRRSSTSASRATTSTSTPAPPASRLIAGWRFLDWLSVEAQLRGPRLRRRP